MQRNVQIMRRNGLIILRQILLRIGIAVATQLGKNGRRLIPRKTGATAEHHVFLGVSHPRKSSGRFVAPDAIVFIHRDRRRQRIANDDDVHPVVQRGAGDIRFGRARQDCQQQSHS